jgi:hypothetical protein
MANKVTQSILRAAAKLEALAKQRLSEKEPEYSPEQPNEWGIRELHTSNPEYIDKLNFVSPNSETGAYCTKAGNLIFYIKF